MYTIEQCLDAILEKLKENWNNSGGRKYLECEKMMTQFGFVPDFRKHEFFMRLIDKLRKDDYAEFTRNEKGNREWIDYYQQETLITVEGYYFLINENSYVKLKQANETALDVKDNRDKLLVRGTWWVAGGAFALVAWELIKTFVFERHYWCDF